LNAIERVRREQKQGSHILSANVMFTTLLEDYHYNL